MHTYLSVLMCTKYGQTDVAATVALLSPVGSRSSTQRLVTRLLNVYANEYCQRIAIVLQAVKRDDTVALRTKLKVKQSE